MMKKLKIACLQVKAKEYKQRYETKENILADSFEDVQKNIQAWAASELQAIDQDGDVPSWEIKKFFVDFTFSKDDEETKTGYRKIIDTAYAS